MVPLVSFSAISLKYMQNHEGRHLQPRLLGVRGLVKIIWDKGWLWKDSAQFMIEGVRCDND